MTIVNPYAKPSKSAVKNNTEKKNDTKPTTQSVVQPPPLTTAQTTQTPKTTKSSQSSSSLTTMVVTHAKQPPLKLQVAELKRQQQRQKEKVAFLKAQKKHRKLLKNTTANHAIHKTTPNQPSSAGRPDIASAVATTTLTPATAITTTEASTTTSSTVVIQTPSVVDNEHTSTKVPPATTTTTLLHSSPLVRTSTMFTKPSGSPDSLEPLPLVETMMEQQQQQQPSPMPFDYSANLSQLSQQPSSMAWNGGMVHPYPYPHHHMMMMMHHQNYAPTPQYGYSPYYGAATPYHHHQQQQEAYHYSPNNLSMHDPTAPLYGMQPQPAMVPVAPPPTPALPSPPAPKQQEPPPPSRICATPCDPPSPFALTHYIVKESISLIKKQGVHASFGITMILDIQHVRTVPKRTFYSVLKVLDPTKQNGRHAAPVLEKDDLILSVNGTSTGGLSFSQACSLFKECPSSCDCVVTIARKRPTLATTTSSGLPTTVLLPPLPAEHYQTLAAAMLQALQDPTRLIGCRLAPDLFRQVLSTLSTPIVQCFDYQTVWKSRVRHWEEKMKAAAQAHWSGRPFSDLRLAQLRNKASVKNPKQCRCGSNSHVRVNHPDCPLYKDLRLLDTAAASRAKENHWNTVKKVLDQRKDLKVVEKAYLDQQVREQSEQQAAEEEVRFVARMRQIQLTKRNQAVLAPSLTAIVLSAVVDLEQEFRGKEFPPLFVVKDELTNEKKTPEPAVEPKPNEEEDDDSDDEDDVPLTALGKRKGDADSLANKKSRRVALVRDLYWARLLNYISNKWGHVYREPSDEEHVWRWEVFHGQLAESGSKWDVSSSSNPRLAGKYSLANIRFLVDDLVALQLESSDSSAQSDALEKLAFACSPSTTGVCDELLALVRTSVVEIDNRGLPVLSQEWWTKIDFLLLDEMRDVWGRVVDRIGKHGVSEQIRTQLEDTWKSTEFGWALADDEDDIVFDAREFSEWWNAFCEQRQSVSNVQDGIGRFR